MAKSQQKKKKTKKKGQTAPKIPLTRRQIAVRAVLAGIAFFLLSFAHTWMGNFFPDEPSPTPEGDIVNVPAVLDDNVPENMPADGPALKFAYFLFGVGIYSLWRVASSMATDIASEHPLFSLSTRTYQPAATCSRSPIINNVMQGDCLVLVAHRVR